MDETRKVLSAGILDSSQPKLAGVTLSHATLFMGGKYNGDSEDNGAGSSFLQEIVTNASIINMERYFIVQYALMKLIIRLYKSWLNTDS